MEKVRDITFVIGPPGTEEDRSMIRGWAKNSGKSEEEIWIEYVHEIIKDLCTPKPPDHAARLNELFTKVIGEPVIVGEPFSSRVGVEGFFYPAVIVETRNVTDARGHPVGYDFSQSQTRELASIFGYVLKANWVRTFTSYGS